MRSPSILKSAPPLRMVVLDNWQSQLYQMVIETRSPQGRAFNLLIYLCTIASVLTVVLGSVQSWRQAYGEVFNGLEWGFTIIFSLDYCLRLLAATKVRRYALSFFGLVDLITILPTYFSACCPRCPVRAGQGIAPPAKPPDPRRSLGRGCPATPSALGDLSTARRCAGPRS